MTKTELQAALAEATRTDKKTAGAFLNALVVIAYKAVKKETRRPHGLQRADAPENEGGGQPAVVPEVGLPPAFGFT